jgi:transposase-like protein
VNRLKPEKQATILSALVEGTSIRSVERMTGVHRDTIGRLALRVGETCEQILDETMRDLPSRRIEVDEVWSFVGKKQRHVMPDDPEGVGDCWVWVALDSDSKIIPTYAVGKRDLPTAVSFMSDLASRLSHRVQISSDGLPDLCRGDRGRFRQRGRLRPDRKDV